MGILHAAAGVVAPWASLYQKSTPIQTAVTFVHFAGLITAAGFAVATDRLTLRAFHAGPDRHTRHLDDLKSVHRPVLIGLSVTALSGLLMLAADLEILASSWIFWIKIGFLILLLGNGLAMTRTEAALRAATAPPRGWQNLRRSALASIALWFAVLFMGTLLPTVS